MSLARTGLVAGTATLLALVSFVQPRTALAQPQGGIALKAGDSVTVGTGQGWVMAIVVGRVMEIDLNDDGSPCRLPLVN